MDGPHGGGDAELVLDGALDLVVVERLGHVHDLVVEAELAADRFVVEEPAVAVRVRGRVGLRHALETGLENIEMLSLAREK